MKRIAYLDCPAGIAGDMTLAALVAAGADAAMVRASVDAVAGCATGLDFAPDKGSGLLGMRLTLDLPHEHVHRTMAVIRDMIRNADMPARVRERSLAVFEVLAAAEGRVHGVPADEVHFHEIGAMDSIVDVVGVAAALESLAIDEVAASPLPLTRGFARTAHGLIPLPAPATMKVLRGFSVYGDDATGEFVTPTGAAICAALAGRGTPMPAMTILSTGFGFGTREWPDGRPNCVRAVIGIPTDVPAERPGAPDVVELAANIDDCTPDQVARLAECLVDSGALDAWICPIFMKKGRPGFLVSALSDAGHVDRLTRLFFTESTTIGVRSRPVARTELERRVEKVSTSLGDVRVKTAFLDGVSVNRLPESDDLREIALKAGLTLKETRRKIEAEIG